jgi:hypothetical protein
MACLAVAKEAAAAREVMVDVDEGVGLEDAEIESIVRENARQQQCRSKASFESPSSRQHLVG